MTLGWSRAQYLDFTDSQALALFLGCHEQAFHYLGGVPEEILYDRVKTVWLHDDDHGDPVFHPGFVDFADYYGFRPRLCRAQRPQTKGKTENGVGYVRKNFWPRVRDYRDANDLLGLRDVHELLLADHLGPSCCNVNCDRSNLPHPGWVRNFKPALSEEFHTGADRRGRSSYAKVHQHELGGSAGGTQRQTNLGLLS